MIHLRTLGGLDLTGRPGHSFEAVLQQPKRIALLAYLAITKPRGFHRRDKLLALFWPDADDEHARGALSQAVYRLRRSLGSAVLLSRGREEVALNPDDLWCDAVAFEVALDAGNVEEALALYRGDLLDGFFLSDAPEFEQWLERERERLRGRASEGCWRLADMRAARGDREEAIRLGCQAAAFAPGDEAAARRLIELLQRLGDRAAAVRAYDDFATRLRDEYALEPSVELRALVDSVRAPNAIRRPVDSSRASDRAAPAPLEQTASSASHSAEDARRDARDSPSAESVPQTERSRRRIPRPAMAAVALLVIVIGGYALFTRGRSVGAPAASGAGADASVRTVAVLPFADLSPGPGYTYFADGLTEEILDALSRVEGIRVPGRTSSFAFKNRDTDVREIGRRLGVAHVLEGSIRIDGERLRVSARLVAVGSGYQLWSQTYDRKFEDVFAIQEEIGRAIIGALRPTLLSEARPALTTQPTHDVEAYNLYLKGRYNFNLRSKEGALAAVRYFREALDRDSGYAIAHAGLADAYALLPVYLLAPTSEILEPARAAALRAIELDSSLAEAHTALAWLSFNYLWDWETAEREFQEALRLNPNHSQAMHFYSLYLARVAGRHDEAVALAARAQLSDPLAPVTHGGAGAVYYHARLFDRAIAAQQHALALDSSYHISRGLLAKAYLAAGRPNDAIAQVNRMPPNIAYVDRSPAVLLGVAHAMLGRRTEALQLLERAKRETTSPVGFAILCTALGLHDEAFTWLDRAVSERDHGIVNMKQEPALDPLRPDPRFARIAARIGLP